MKIRQKDDMSFLEHLEELRWHVVRSAIAILVIAIAAFIFKDFLFNSIILAPSQPHFFTNSLLCSLSAKYDIGDLCINQSAITFQNITMSGQFTAHLKTAIITGIVVAFPYIFFEIWSFVNPALKPNEKRSSRGAIFFISVLFFIGICFSYYIICPLTIDFFSTYKVSESVENIWTLKTYISTMTSTILGGGIVFELPIIIYFTSSAGLVSSTSLKKYRKHALVACLAVAAFITPPDPFTQLIVCVPLFLLYEFGIKIAKHVERKKAEKETGLSTTK